jgi:hypothetical protein
VSKVFSMFDILDIFCFERTVAYLGEFFLIHKFEVKHDCHRNMITLMIKA